MRKKHESKKQPGKPKLSKNSSSAYWIVLSVLLLIVAAVRLRLLAIPFERDEGEYAYTGSLLLKGLPLYSEAFTLKLPGTALMYALFQMLFGRSVEGIHLGLMLVNLATIVLLFISASKLFSSGIAVCTAAIYGIMSLSASVYGFAAHATQFVAFFTALALFFYSRYLAEGRRATALMGLSAGMAFLMKQHASYLIFFFLLLVIIESISGRKLHWGRLIMHGSCFFAGAALPCLTVVLLTTANGTFGSFWFHTVEYAREYVSEVTLLNAFESFMISFRPMWTEFALIWILAFVALVAIWFHALEWKRKLLAALFFLFSFLTLTPGFYFRPHYFVMWLPSVALMASISVFYMAARLKQVAGKRLAGLIPYLIAATMLLVAMWRGKDYYFIHSPLRICKDAYGINPFTESEALGRFLRSNTTPQDRILILGSEPQILFYADRLSATPYIYTYGLVEKQKYNRKMQQEFIRYAEAAAPRYALFINIANSWLIHPEAPADIRKWTDSSIIRKYQVAGLVEMNAERSSDFFWGAAARMRRPQTAEYILVLERMNN